jgi:hypothetical protein
MVYEVQLSTLGELVKVWFDFVLLDYGHEYWMKSMLKRDLGNWTIASFQWLDMWSKSGPPD